MHADFHGRGFNDPQRLAWHQAQSGPKMAELKHWLTEQIEQHQVEPNSSLGEAITYMRKHWEALTETCFFSSSCVRNSNV